MLLSKSFAVLVEPVKKPSSVVTSDQPFFDPGVSTSVMSSCLVTEVTGSSLVQTTGEAASLSASHPVREGLRLPARVLSTLLKVLV